MQETFKYDPYKTLFNSTFRLFLIHLYAILRHDILSLFMTFQDAAFGECHDTYRLHYFTRKTAIFGLAAFKTSKPTEKYAIYF